MVKLIALLLVTAVGCGSKVDATADSSTSPEDIGIADAAASWDVFADPDACSPYVPANPYGDPSDATPPDVAPPPHVACTAREVGPCDDPVCEPPPSRCADSDWLVYYTEGACVEGSCQWVAKTLHCPIGCASGGCISRGTTK